MTPARRLMGSALVGSALVVAGCTLASRLVGLARDVAIAYRFGSHPVVDAFEQSYRVVDGVVYLLAGGGAAAAVIPVLVRLRSGESAEAGWSFLRGVLAGAAGVLFLLALGAALLADRLATLLGPGFSPAQLELTAALVRMLLPSMLFLGLGSVAGAALNACGHFAWPALSWGILNLGILGGAWLSRRVEPPDEAIRLVAAGLVVGSAGALGVQLGALRQRGLVLRGRPRLGGAAQIEALRVFGPAAVVLLAGYLYVELAAIWASTGGEGWVMLLRYAARLVKVPVGLVGAALSVALLPLLASAAATGDGGDFARHLRRALVLGMGCCLPAAAFLSAARLPLVRLLFERGQFLAADSERLADLLGPLALGLPALALVLLLTQAFYACSDSRTPAGVLSGLLVPFALACPWALGRWGVPGLAWLLGAAWWAQAGLLAALWRRRFRRPDWGPAGAISRRTATPG